MTGHGTVVNTQLLCGGDRERVMLNVPLVKSSVTVYVAGSVRLARVISLYLSFIIIIIVIISGSGTGDQVITHERLAAAAPSEVNFHGVIGTYSR